MAARRWIAATLTTLLLAGAGAALAAEDYTDPAWRDHDLDNLSRSSARQRAQATDPEYHLAAAKSGGRAWMDAQANQLADLNAGRLHTGLGQLLPGGAVGDPKAYDEMTPRRIQFLSRTGAKLSGRIWGSEAPGPRPGVVITTGSIQGTEHMYWWAARSLARAGYVVFTWDVQGQGESESFGHAFGDHAPTSEGFPSQQEANFTDGTIDALRFFLSTPASEYVPGGTTGAEVAAAKATAQADVEHLDWVNPAWGVLDRSRLGIAGHSLGGTAVSKVQQCSDAAELWRTLPLCTGRSFPIRAVVGWDSLSATVTPVVPGMNQQADGYFLNPTPSPQSPSAAAQRSHLAAHDKWVAAGLDTYSVTVRGGTHIEWTEIPYILPATAYGTALADHYTLAWMDRWVKGDGGAFDRLVAAPTDRVNTPAAAAAPWNAHHLSARYLSAYRLTPPEPAAAPVTVIDLRKAGDQSRVGDWAGANADRVGRELP